MVGKKVIDYKVVSGSDKDILRRAVLSELQGGWQLQGGVSFTGYHFIQALVKYEKEVGCLGYEK